MKQRERNICPNCYHFTFYFVTIENYKKCNKCGYEEPIVIIPIDNNMDNYQQQD